MQLDRRITKLLGPSSDCLLTTYPPNSATLFTPIGAWLVPEWMEPWLPLTETEVELIRGELEASRFPPSMVREFLSSIDKPRLRDINWHDALWLVGMARRFKTTK